MSEPYRRRIGAPLALACALVGVGLGAGVGGSPAAADTAPPAGSPATVSADALPTAQINGVVWAQVVVGDTVYATGRFTRARPAGVAAGGAGEGPAGNVVAFSISTGRLGTSFSHSLNAQGLALAASPDGTKVYVGGDFTTIDGQTRGHLAAFDTATGALDPAFKPSVSSTVAAVQATAAAVYAGGNFSRV